MDQVLFNSHKVPERSSTFFYHLMTSFKKLKALIQGHKASKCQSGDSNLRPAVFVVQMLYLSTATGVWHKKAMICK